MGGKEGKCFSEHYNSTAIKMGILFPGRKEERNAPKQKQKPSNRIEPAQTAQKKRNTTNENKGRSEKEIKQNI